MEPKNMKEFRDSIKLAANKSLSYSTEVDNECRTISATFCNFMA